MEGEGRRAELGAMGGGNVHEMNGGKDPVELNV